MRARETNLPDPTTTALSALAWTISDEDRAARLLALTGLDGDALRARATEPALLAAVLGFLASHEPDLEACADALALSPTTIVAAQAALEARS